MTNSLFNAEFYERYRPLYPASTFAGMREELLRRGFSEPFSVVDIGCGTGHSIASLLRTGIQARCVGIDPDSQMLERARVLVPHADLRLGSGEAPGLASESMDAGLIGSALHWMDCTRVAKELARVIKPHGLLRAFEYQFPKARGRPDLNEWIRRQFNLYWKAPAQVPRGDFEAVTSGFRDSPEWEHVACGAPPMECELTTSDLFGLILSQSRVLHYEATLESTAIESFRQALRESLESHMRGSSLVFDFKLEWVEFRKR